MYGVLGVGSYGLELGEDFYEDCGLFEKNVIPINMPALLYATKIAKKPFSLVKGPDITSLDVAQDEVQDDVMTVTVIASDSLYLDGQHTTGDQGVAQVRVFLNVHPDDYEDGDTVWAIAATKQDGDEQTFELEVMIPQGVPSGQHTLYAQAMDNDGYFGPVTSVFFDLERVETDAPSNQPTRSPSLRPSRAPTTPVSNAFAPLVCRTLFLAAVILNAILFYLPVCLFPLSANNCTFILAYFCCAHEQSIFGTHVSGKNVMNEELLEHHLSYQQV